MRFKLSDKGVSLIELIIAVTIMAVISSVLVPQYIKYLDDSRRTLDVANAEKIAQAFQMAVLEYPDAMNTYQAWKSFEKPVSVTVNGVKEKYRVYGIMTNKPDDSSYNGAFWGTERKFVDKRDGSPGLYTYVNNMIGVDRHDSVQQNSKMLPKYKVRCDITPIPDTWRAGRDRIDRWRIVKRKDNGNLEVWAAENSVGGDGGGYPIYRVWPVPDDVYTE